MKKLRITISLLLGLVIVMESTSTAMASKVTAVPVNTCNELGATTEEIDKLIQSVDLEQLRQDALNGINKTAGKDYGFNVHMECALEEERETAEVQTNQIVQKIGEITKSNGEKSNLYVTVAASNVDTTVSNAYNEKYGVEAFIFLYWIDNLGTDNELYRVAAEWETHDMVVSDRSVTYGKSDPSGLFFTSSTTVNCTTSFNKVVHGEYTGLSFKAKSEAYVTNLGTISCEVHTTILD